MKNTHFTEEFQIEIYPLFNDFDEIDGKLYLHFFLNSSILNHKNSCNKFFWKKSNGNMWTQD